MKKAQRIFSGGTILTMDDSHPRAEAVAVADGYIVCVGDLEEVKAFAGEETEWVNLGGKTVIPGFIEAHGHPYMSALAWGDPVVDIRAVHEPTYEAALAKIRRRVVKAGPGELIWFLGLDPQLHVGMEEPSQDLLDSIAPNVAIVVQTQNFHAAYLNTRACEAFGITADYEPPLGGKFVPSPNGLPWKLLETAAWQLCSKFYELCGEDRNKRVFRDWITLFTDAGYTTTSEIMMDPGSARIMQAAVKSGPKSLRIVGYEGVHKGGDVTVPMDFGDDHFRVVGTKMHADGSVLAGNVWTSRPYLNTDMTIKGMGLPPNSTGHPNVDSETLTKLVLKYVAQGYQMSVHAHGDRSIDMVLDAYEEAERTIDNIARPLRIEHCGTMRDDQIDRAIRLDVVCSFFLPYLHYWGEALRDNLLGDEATARFVPSGTATRRGMRVSYHCDPPMTWPNPFVCLDVAVTRRTRAGSVLGEDQAVPVETALKALTLDAAYHLRMDDRIGSIEVGKYADFTILSDDPTRHPKDRLLEIKVLGTVLEGVDVVPSSASPT